MTVSTKTAERGLDTMLIVYSLLAEHPASGVCEQFLREHTGWFVTPFILLETKALLTKVYGIEPAAVTQKLTQFAQSPVQVVTLDASETLAALHLADTHQIDLTDATLLQCALSLDAKTLATDDARLAQTAATFSIGIENPLDLPLRQEIAEWEQAHLPQKGLPRILSSVHHWLLRTYPEAAETFWSQTGAGSHLP